MTKKITSILLCICLIASTVNVVFAIEQESVVSDEAAVSSKTIPEITEETTTSTETVPVTTEGNAIMNPDQVAAKYHELINAATIEEMDSIIAQMSTDELNAFVSALTEEQVNQINSKADTLTPPETTPVPEESEQPDNRPIVYPSKNFTNAAPFLPPVVGVIPSGEDDRLFLDPPKPDNGVETSKTVSGPDADGQYTLTLEAWVTGNKTIIDQEIQVPTDIVLVLDQSGSMSDDFETVVYEQFRGEPEELYNNQKKLYVKRSDGSYAPVTVIRTEIPLDTYTSFSGLQNGEYSSNSGKFYHKCPNGEYGIVHVIHEFLKDYTYECEVCGQIGRDSRYTHVPSFSTAFYRKDVDIAYTFSYKEKDGTTVTATVKQTDPSPDWDFYMEKRGKTISRLKALQTAVTNFTNAVAEKAKGADGQLGTNDDINHRIAMVGFASTKNSSSGKYRNTEIFIGSKAYRYDQVTDANYADAFQNMNEASGVENIQQSIEILEAKGATYVNHGVELGNNIFMNHQVPQGQKRNRIMIVFTDGQPGSSGYDGDVAGDAIAAAKVTKDRYGATVYSVGIFQGADATSAGKEHGTETQMSNWFMQNLSSNEGVVQDPSYYLSAADSEALNNIFQTISDNIESGGSAIQLGTETIMKDVISDSFQLPEGTNNNDMKAYTADYIGENSFSDKTPFDATVDISQDGKSVCVTNFDYSENWVGTVTDNGQVSYRGKKLIVEIPIIVRDGFLGGNGVRTNGADSGIYNEDKIIENFEVPTVNVPIPDIAVQAPDKNVYLLGGLTQEQLMQDVVVTAGGVNLLQEPEPWQAEYVDIIITKPGAMSNLTTGQSYTVTAEIAPKPSTAPGNVDKKTGMDLANVNVFVPELTFQDSIVYYGDNTPIDYDRNYVSTEWKHGKTSDRDVAMIGYAPGLELTYQPGPGIENGIINTKVNIPVNVTVKIGDQNIEDYVKFAHKDCDNGCGFDSATEEFLLHVKTCQLTIHKQGGMDGEPYVFYVYKDDEKYTELTITGNGSETICELPVGDYTLAEDANWAWRYSDIQVGSGANLTSTNPSGTITCTNANRLDQWLNGFSSVVQNIMGIPRSQS